VIDDVLRATDARLAAHAAADRPFITLSYAQSLDGSIAHRDGRPLALSSPPSLFRTHALRARHGGLLVGIGTILSDNPQLTVRHAAGPNPQPIVLDTQLRTPLPARVLANPRRPWFVAGAPVSPPRRTALLAAGAQVLEVPRTSENLVDLPAALAALAQRGLGSIMVEGGSRVLHSFLAARLVDWVVITLAPVFVAGKPALSAAEGPAMAAVPGKLPGVHLLGWEASGPDLILWGDLR
jgi:3,4-dihydroxy 2-butanone 4-phosphate synthase/GTP cyclohydrolase II